MNWLWYLRIFYLHATRRTIITPMTPPQSLQTYRMFISMVQPSPSSATTLPDELLMTILSTTSRQFTWCGNGHVSWYMWSTRDLLQNISIVVGDRGCSLLILLLGTQRCDRGRGTIPKRRGGHCSTVYNSGGLALSTSNLVEEHKKSVQKKIWCNVILPRKLLFICT